VERVGRPRTERTEAGRRAIVSRRKYPIPSRNRRKTALRNGCQVSWSKRAVSPRAELSANRRDEAAQARAAMNRAS
jgi:hypothetical protein